MSLSAFSCWVVMPTESGCWLSLARRMNLPLVVSGGTNP